MVEAWRRKVVVLARLENRGENAYGTTVHVSTSSNLLFSSLILKVGNNLGKGPVCHTTQQASLTFPQDQSDVQMECFSGNQLANELSCNISAPFMKMSSQVGVASAGSASKRSCKHSHDAFVFR